MADKPRILCLAGSARKASLNRKLARAAAGVAGERGADIELLELADYPMPLYDGDLEAAEGLPDNAILLRRRFIDSDGLLIASPEYNSSMPPLLKNTLDWVSRKENEDDPALAAYRGKVAALLATSPGAMGGTRGLIALRMMLGNIGVHVVPAQLTVPGGGKAFDDNGALVDDGMRKRLQGVVDELVRTTARLAGD